MNECWDDAVEISFCTDLVTLPAEHITLPWEAPYQSMSSLRSNGNVHLTVSPSKVCWSTTRRLWTSTSSPKEVSWGEVLLGKSLLELTLLERAWKYIDLWDGIMGGGVKMERNLIKGKKLFKSLFLCELSSTAGPICSRRCAVFKIR